jgi:hypothetical protein
MATISCKDNQKKEEDIKLTTKTDVEKISDYAEDKIKLNNGELWIANQETTEGINNMIHLVDSFNTEGDNDSYQTLVDSLNAEFSMIFKKCTMKGEAHNQLHHYLLPMKNKFTELLSTDLDERKTSVAGLKKHLSIYKAYFQ